MIKTIFFLLEAPFTERDYNRFGIEVLSKSFNVFVLDCTEYLKPSFFGKYKELVFNCGELHSISDLKQIELFAQSNKEGSLAIDMLGYDSQSHRIRLLLQNNRIPRTVVGLGLIPKVSVRSIGFVQKIGRLLKAPKSLGRRFFRCIKELVNPCPPPEIALCSGRASLDDPRYAAAKRKIFAHSFDYDQYLVKDPVNVMESKPYAVFLDEDMVFHSDYEHCSIAAPATEHAYFDSMSEFFSAFEQNYGYEVVVAAHPRARYDLRPGLWRGRKHVYGETSKLVRGAAIVLCHQSTSVSYAVLWKKPVVCLTSDEIKSSFIGPRVSVCSSLLGAPLFNIDQKWSFPTKEELLTINQELYSSYIKQYIKIPGTPEKPVWEIFSDYVKYEMVSTF